MMEDLHRYDALAAIDTPSAIVDIPRMQRNIARMQTHIDALGTAFRPHVKTTKCIEIVHAQLAAGARGIAVSTLQEAETFFAAGVTDILYAVSVAPPKLPRAMALRRQGCDLKLVVDNAAAASAVAQWRRDFGDDIEAWIEVDTDGHRGGLAPEHDALLNVGRILHESGIGVGGVMTHAGSSYALSDREALAALAERERAGALLAAQRLRTAGMPCKTVSVGSTPTALAARRLDGVTEVRAGVYALFDLVMRNVGVCSFDDIALSVLTTVIGHQPEKGWMIVDAGWMAMSRDRGTSQQADDFGYGLPCTLDGTPLVGYRLSSANQEHGIISRASTAASDAPSSAIDLQRRFPVGSKLRILPNHACATGAQFAHYHSLSQTGGTALWRRFNGW